MRSTRISAGVLPKPTWRLPGEMSSLGERRRKSGLRLSVCSTSSRAISTASRRWRLQPTGWRCAKPGLPSIAVPIRRWHPDTGLSSTCPSSIPKIWGISSGRSGCLMRSAMAIISTMRNAISRSLPNSAAFRTAMRSLAVNRPTPNWIISPGPAPVSDNPTFRQVDQQISRLATEHSCNRDQDACADEAGDEVADPAAENDAEQAEQRIGDNRPHDTKNDVHEKNHIALNELFGQPAGNATDNDCGHPADTCIFHKVTLLRC